MPTELLYPTQTDPEDFNEEKQYLISNWSCLTQLVPESTRLTVYCLQFKVNSVGKKLAEVQVHEHKAWIIHFYNDSLHILCGSVTRNYDYCTSSSFASWNALILNLRSLRKRQDKFVDYNEESHDAKGSIGVAGNRIAESSHDRAHGEDHFLGDSYYYQVLTTVVEMLHFQICIPTRPHA
ncbi:hypothetical protein STEG23_003205, partial [Scotinomys teguina]